MPANLLDALLQSWDRNNTVMVKTLHALPEGGLQARAMAASPPVSALFTHIHYVRLVEVYENAPEFAIQVTTNEWQGESSRERIAQMLDESAAVVRNAVRGRLEAGKEMDLHFDHPILLLQQLIWHEAYHLGQMRLALKAAGCPMPDAVAGPASWNIWMDKT